MNLQHERLTECERRSSCPSWGQNYGAAAQQAAKEEMAYSDFLEALLREEMAGRTVRKQTMITRLAGFPAIKTLDQFNNDFATGLKRSQIEEPAGLGRTSLTTLLDNPILHPELLCSTMAPFTTVKRWKRSDGSGSGSGSGDDFISTICRRTARSSIAPKSSGNNPNTSGANLSGLLPAP